MSRGWFAANRHRYPDDWDDIATAVKLFPLDGQDELPLGSNS